MKKKLIALIGAVSLLSACETASQKVVSGTAATSKGSSASVVQVKVLVQVKVYLLKPNKQHADKLIAVGDRVLFDYDSAKLDSSSKILLDAQSRFLRANTDLNFIVEGHCDERGTREYNLALRRAKSYCSKRLLGYTRY